MIKLAADLELVDLALYVEGSRSLALADPHLGYEQALSEAGVLVPRSHLKRVEQRVTRIFEQLNSSSKLDTLIINGDLRHRFGPLSYQERIETKELLEFFSNFAAQIVIVRGNHDPNLAFLTKAFHNVEITKYYEQGHYLFVHGDELPPRIPDHIETIIIAHEHPAVSLRDPITGRVETYKCFLAGSFQNRRLLVQPSFNLLVNGSDLTKEKVISPFIDETHLGEFDVFIVSDDGCVYDFGKLKQLL